MQPAFILILLLFPFWFSPVSAQAAPFLAPGQITGTAGPADPPEQGLAKGMISLSIFTQKNESPLGRERFAWIDPEDDNQEERHRARKWRSIYDMQGLSLRAAYAFSAVSAYLLAGMAQTDITFSYRDETRKYQSSSAFYDESTRFRDESHLFFGGGLTAAMARWQPNPDTRIALDADLSYRYHALNPEDQNSRSWSAALHEIQGAMTLGLMMEKWTPFTGLRISHISGEMTYEDKKEGIRVSKSIEAGKDIGYTFGIRYRALPWLDLTLASRYGDESGYHLECAFVF
jgi:hypothetical protein